MHVDLEGFDLAGYWTSLPVICRNLSNKPALDSAAPMELEPPSLNVRLVPRNYFGLVVLASCILVAAASAAFISPRFSLVFSACVVVALPGLFWFFAPTSFRLPYWGGFERVAAYALFFGYLALAKSVLVPFVIGLLERAFV